MSNSPEQSVLVRDYRRADQADVIETILSIQREEFGFGITVEDQPDLIDVAGFYLKDGGGFWVAEVDEKIAGTIALKDIGGGDGALRKMFVRSEYRGPVGVAKALVGHLFGHARAAGLSNLYLGTTDRFLAAHRFYEKTGFRRIDADDLPPAFPRMALDTRFYALDLGHDAARP